MTSNTENPQPVLPALSCRGTMITGMHWGRQKKKVRLNVEGLTMGVGV